MVNALAYQQTAGRIQSFQNRNALAGPKPSVAKRALSVLPFDMVRFGADATPELPRKTKIVATLGPAGDNQIEALIDAGVNIFRLNFSHGSQPEHAERVTKIREAAKKLGKSVEILADLQGPKFRIGKMPDEGITLEEGKPVKLVLGSDYATTAEGTPIIPVQSEIVMKSIKPGERILMDDGKLSLDVVSLPGDGDPYVTCKVKQGGKLTSKKGLNLPGTRLDMPFLSDKDKSDLEFVLKQGIDYLSLSFVRTAKDVEEAVAYAKTKTATLPKLVAKIEKPEALEGDNLKNIVKLVDGIMVARGDLGIEIPDIADLPRLQEQIINTANAEGPKLVICATQMLESMLDSAMPSRSDVNDIANAVRQGASATMLSGETAMGKFPVKAVKMMSRIIQKTEAYMESKKAATTPAPTGLKQTLQAGLDKLAKKVQAARTQLAEKFPFLKPKKGD